MKLAPIPPVKLVGLCRGDYNMILAPWAMRHNNYRQYWRLKPGHKIMDNGEAEGEQIPFDKVCELAVTCRAKEVILPDVMHDGPATRERVKEAASVCKLYPELKFTAVVHGHGLPEAGDHIQAYADMSHVNSIALPRILGNTITRYARPMLVEKFNDLFTKRFGGVHMLGATEWVGEVTVLSEYASVRGIDSALPVVIGLQNGLIEHAIGSRSFHQTRLPNYETLDLPDRGASRVYDIILHNIGLYSQWASYS